MLPNFLVVGGQKCATTSLHHYLIQHPEIFLPKVKETKFFVMDERYGAGVDNYKENFADAGSELAVGEVDPDYMYFEVALGRMRQHLNIDELKLIFLLRNPVERAYSHYLMTHRRGLESETFKNALTIERARIKEGYFSRSHYSYVDRGFYLEQIKRFEQYVDKCRMHFILTEDLEFNRSRTLKDCFKFLGVDEAFTKYDKNRVHHKGKIPRSGFFLNEIANKKDSFAKKVVRFLVPHEPARLKLRAKLLSLNEKDNNMKMDVECRRYLEGIYREPNQKLSDYIGRDLAYWEV